MFVELFNQAGSIIWIITFISVITMAIGIWLIIFHKNFRIIKFYFLSAILPIILGIIGSIQNSTLATFQVALVFSILIIVFGLPSYVIHKVRFRNAHLKNK
jgi:ABC-type multidrug transport system permease subunit